MMVGVEAGDTVPEPSGYRKGPNRGPFSYEGYPSSLRPA